jgi:hypothetical protein
MTYRIRKGLTHRLWSNYIKAAPEYYGIFSKEKLAMDHFAIIDFTSKYSGIDYLKEIFKLIGYTERGAGYLPDKQNNFMWLSSPEFSEKSPKEALPQPIIADFCNDKFSKSTRKIIEKYSKCNYQNFDLTMIKSAMKDAEEGNQLAEHYVVDVISGHLNSKFSEHPTLKEYEAVKEENQLLAWILLFGRRINHFGVGVCPESHSSLENFNSHVQNNYNAVMNKEGGLIKGGAKCGIEQSSTMGKVIEIKLEDGVVKTNDSFLEFVWRYPVKPSPKAMKDYYMDFIPVNADRVIESLFVK